LIGWAFMWATISVEGTDAFDAVSRAYAYTYHRPLRLLWYVMFAALLGALGMFVVKFFALATIAIGDWSIHWGLDHSNMQQLVVQPDERIQDNLSGVPLVAASAIRFWKSFLTSIAAGYQAGYLWAAAVGIYLLLRRDVDAAELDEVFLDDEEPDFGMPPLEDDESGVPEVAPTEAAVAGAE
jgi:hypothetical protein